MDFIRSLTKKEWKFLAICSLLLIFLSSVGYVVAWINTPKDMVYTGVHSITPGDIPVYLSYINEVKEGSYLIHDRMTGETDQGIFNLVWFSTGILARLFNFSPLLAFHFMRILLIPLLCLASYYGISQFSINTSVRKFALVLFCFASGVGAMIAPFIQAMVPNGLANIDGWPFDLWVPEISAFISVNNSPHMILSFIFMILMMTFAYKSFTGAGYLYAIYSGLIGLIWFSYHPFYFPLVFFILIPFSIYTLFNSKDVAGIYKMGIILLISLPAILMHYFIISKDPVDAAKATQNTLMTNEPFYFIVGLGLLLFFAVINLYNRIIIEKRKDNETVFMTLWVIFGLLAPYLPIFFQRRLILGITLPLALLTADSLYPIWKTYIYKLKPYLKSLLLSLFVVLFFQSTLFQVVREFTIITTHDQLLYLPKGVVKASEFISRESPKVVLSDVFNSLFLPVYGNFKVFVAHGVETVDYYGKIESLSNFYTGKFSMTEMANFIEKNNISHLVVGNYDFVPNPNFFEVEFETGEYKVYKVKGN